MRRYRPALAVVVCAALLGGCASGDDGAAPSTSPTDAGGGEAATLLAVSGRSLDGGDIDLGSFVGDHLVLWMWAPW